jgi:signal transduction histidine kinase
MQFGEIMTPNEDDGPLVSIGDRSQGQDTTEVRSSGIALVGDVPWGTHFCQFYETDKDLIEVLVPYFLEGLESNEFCMWVTSPPLGVEEATEALRKAVPNLDDYLAKGQLDILDYSQWYTKSGRFDADEVLQGWVDKLTSALQNGFDGLRLTGNTHWLEDANWNDFAQYEEAVDSVIGRYRMIALCTYSLEKCGASEILDVVANHEFALIRREGRWELIGSAGRKRIEQELNVQRKKFEAMFKASNEGMALHEIVYGEGRAVDYRILDVNPSFESITSIARGKAVGRLASRLYGTGEPPYLDIYAQVVETGTPVVFETEFPPMRKHFLISVFCPAPGQFATMFLDITERKRAEEEIMRSNAELQQFAYVASHDLQEPLRMVSAYLSLLERKYGDKLDGTAKEYMDYAIDGGQRARNLINDLLAYSRVDSQAKAFHATNMEDVLGKTLDFLSVRINAETAIISHDSLPTILADESQMVQVMQNLIGNAIKFHGAEQPRVHVSFQDDGTEWRFSIQDNGIGIDPKFKDKIFIMFQRLHTRNEYEGTGIGLAICKKIVERHGGRIWFDSRPGSGTTFYFTIPNKR